MSNEWRLGLAGFLVAIAALAGCQTSPDRDLICMTRQSDDLTGPKRVYWHASRTIYLTDTRGKTQLLAQSEPVRVDRPPGGGSAGSQGSTSRPDSQGSTGSAVEQTLYIRLIWGINPSQSGTDPSAMNAHIGYLVRGATTQPDRAGLYYEGMGNVYVQQPGVLGGKKRFIVRHALLRLTRSNRDRIVDPLGLVELTAEISAGADPQSSEQFRQIVDAIDGLPPAGQTAPPPPPVGP